MAKKVPASLSSRTFVTAIETEADIRKGVAALRRRCAVMTGLHDALGDPPLRRLTAGFPGLARVVVSQQLSAASAAAIWARVEALVVPFEPAVLLAQPDEQLRGAGLSGGKIRTLRALADAVASGFDLAAIEHAPEEEAVARLCALHGIGPWTAHIYLMFCLGRADMFAPGDLALRLELFRLR